MTSRLVPGEVYSLAALQQSRTEFGPELALTILEAKDGQWLLEMAGSDELVSEFLNRALDLSAQEVCR